MQHCEGMYDYLTASSCLGTRIRACEAKAKEHISKGEEWTFRTKIWRWLMKSEHDVIANLVRQSTERVRGLANHLKSRGVAPPPVMAHLTAEDILACCKRCAWVNRERVRHDEPFRCEADLKAHESSAVRPHFPIKMAGKAQKP